MVGVMPVPLSATLCGLVVALSVIVTLALRLPLAVGEKVTLLVQAALTANVLGPIGQVLVWAKSAALVPLRPVQPPQDQGLRKIGSVELAR